MSTCEQAHALIDALVLDELSDADRAVLAAHVRSCPACAAELGSVTKMLELFAGAADAPASEDFDERVIAAAIADRDRRLARRNWLSTLWRQAWHGAVRTTGTLAVTLIVVAFAMTTLVVAAVNLFPGFHPIVTSNPPTPPAATQPVIAQNPTPTQAPTATPVGPTIMTTPVVTTAPTPQPVVTPQPTPQPTPKPTPSATPRPTPEPTPAPTATPTPTPAPTVTTTPEPEPTPSPTPKRRTPPPNPSAESPSP